MVRYADGPTETVEVDIAAPISEVWALVTDLDLPAGFSDEFQGADWLDGAEGPALGARFRGHNRHRAIGEWTTVCTVTAFEPRRVFGWDVGEIDAPAASWRFELEPRASGTLLRQWARMGPGPSRLTPAIAARPDREEQIVARRREEWRRNMTATVEGIKDLAERRHQRSAP